MADHLIMRTRIQQRLMILVAAIVLMGLGIVVLTAKMEWQSEALRAQLEKLKDPDSFRIADEFANSLWKINESLFRYGRSHTPPDFESFKKASEELNVWIGAQDPKLRSMAEKDAMKEIHKAYGDYLRVARQLLDRLQNLGDASATIDEYDGLREESRHLVELGQNLAKAHFESKSQLMVSEDETLTELRVLVLFSLCLLFVFGVILAWLVYRDMILPLRLKLVETQNLAERREKLASLGMLAAGVAHEIRNPLTAIKAALFMQQKKFGAGTEEFADAQVVEREILRLERIVNDFLLFARPAEPHLATINAVSALSEVQTLLTPQLTKAGIQLKLEKSSPAQIKVDAAQIKQVLINLVQNAADAVGEGGVIKLRARPDRKRIQNQEQIVVVLEVTDNGKGISPEVQKRLFDPFFSTKDTGTGLGLSIAAGIVQKHGGALQYQTQVDYGTTFGIILPQAANERGGKDTVD